MNGVPIKVISMEKGVMVSHPKGYALVKTDEETFRACYEWGLVLADFYPAKGDLYLKSYELDEAICAQIQTELVILVLQKEFDCKYSQVRAAATPLAARLQLTPEMFRHWEAVVLAHRKLLEYHPCRVDVSEVLVKAMLGINGKTFGSAYSQEFWHNRPW